VILGVDVTTDKEPAARDFVERYKLTYPVGRDVEGDITSLYGVTGTPTVFYVDRAGKLVGRHEGELNEADFRQRIANLLK
jgi:cytochrome c biogenesis protein CcmG/thiol:disulfide interchange protein DsbE